MWSGKKLEEIEQEAAELWLVQAETYGHTTVVYPRVAHPTVISFPNNYKYPILFDEKKLGSGYDYVLHERGVMVCVDDGCWGGWGVPEPPVYDIWPKETLIVRPKLKYWGKGLKEE